MLLETAIALLLQAAATAPASAPAAPAAAAARAAPPAAAAPGPSDGDPAALREKVRGLLGAIDRPVGAATWRALGPGAIPILQEIAESRDRLPAMRARALDALGLMGGPEAEATALRVAQGPAHPWDVRAAAVRGLGRLLPQDRLVAALRPMLAIEGPSAVREAAAEVLAVRGGASGCAAVRGEASRSPRADGALRRALVRCR